jgi:RNA polymerase sigma factor (TIGR02999 family)
MGGPGPAAPDPDEYLGALNALLRGDSGGEDLAERIYAELRKLAEHHMREQPAGSSLQTTALINEAWMRFSGPTQPSFEGRRQFFAFASRTMRSVLVDHARKRAADKRGGGGQRVSITDAAELSDPERGADTLDLLDLNDALVRLQAREPELARLVELRFFGGLSNQAVAELLGVTERSIERRWRFARAWLRDELSR